MDSTASDDGMVSPSVMVVPAEDAERVIEGVRVSLAQLEQELAEARRLADDAEHEAGGATASVPDSHEHLRRLADGLLAQASRCAAQIRADAAAHAAALLEASPRSSEPPAAPPATVGRREPLLRLAPSPD